MRKYPHIHLLHYFIVIYLVVPLIARPTETPIHQIVLPRHILKEQTKEGATQCQVVTEVSLHNGLYNSSI